MWHGSSFLGFLYQSEETSLLPLISSHSQKRRKKDPGVGM